jgi:hypothetical protein
MVFIGMKKKINYRFVSLYYRDNHQFISEVIQFVKDFKDILQEESFYSIGNKYISNETNELTLVHITPQFVKHTKLEYTLNDERTTNELITQIEKDIQSILGNAYSVLDEAIVITFVQEIESDIIIENQFENNELEFIYQFNSNYHHSVDSMLKKVKQGLRKYFENPDTYTNLTSDIYDIQKSNTITVGEIVNSFESPIELAFDFNDYSDEQTMYEMIENTLTQMNLINKPKELTLVIQLVYRFLVK